MKIPSQTHSMSWAAWLIAAQHTALMDGNFVDARRSTLMMSVGGEISWKSEKVWRVVGEKLLLLNLLPYSELCRDFPGFFHGMMSCECVWLFNFALSLFAHFRPAATLICSRNFHPVCARSEFTCLSWQLRSTVRELENMRTQLQLWRELFFFLFTAAAMINLTFWLLPLLGLRRWEMNSTTSHRAYEKRRKN